MTSSTVTKIYHKIEDPDPKLEAFRSFCIFRFSVVDSSKFPHTTLKNKHDVADFKRLQLHY